MWDASRTLDLFTRVGTKVSAAERLGSATWLGVAALWLASSLVHGFSPAMRWLLNPARLPVVKPFAEHDPLYVFFDSRRASLRLLRPAEVKVVTPLAAGRQCLEGSLKLRILTEPAS